MATLMKDASINIMIIGVSCLDGMAPSTRIRNLLEPLIQKKLLTASNLIYQKDANGLTETQGVINDINYKVIGFRKSNPFSVFSFMWKGLGFIQKNKSSANKNILYSYDQPDLRNILFIFWAKILGYKIVLDIIEDNTLYINFPRLLTRIKVKSSVFFLKHAKFYSDHIIAISSHIYELTSKIAKGKFPVTLIPITVDLNKFKLKDYTIPQQFKVFYGGSFGDKDGLNFLIEAFENVVTKFPGVTLTLTGRGAGHDMKIFFDLLEKSVAKNNIIYKGYLSPEEYYEVINECDIFCMARVASSFANAGFPFKLGEFLATGKCVIATSIGDVPNYLKNNVNALLIKPSSAEDISDALLYLLNNPEQINKLGTEGRKTAEQYFDSAKVSAQLFSIFQSCN